MAAVDCQSRSNYCNERPTIMAQRLQAENCCRRRTQRGRGDSRMPMLSRRRAMMLASSYAAALPLLNGGNSRAQDKPGAAATVFEMADFSKSALDADTAFARALAAISKSAGEAAKAGKPVPIVLNLEKNATYRIKQPLELKRLTGLQLNGNQARLGNSKPTAP